jgi:hypothetical protein
LGIRVKSIFIFFSFIFLLFVFLPVKLLIVLVSLFVLILLPRQIGKLIMIVLIGVDVPRLCLDAHFEHWPHLLVLLRGLLIEMRRLQQLLLLRGIVLW